MDPNPLPSEVTLVDGMASRPHSSRRPATHTIAPTAHVKPLLRNPPSGGSVPSPTGVLARTSRSDDSRFAARHGSEASDKFVSGRRSTKRSAPTAQAKPLLRNPPSGGSVPSPSGVPARTSRSDDSRFAARKGSEASAQFVSGRRSTNRSAPTAQAKPLLRNPPSGGSVPSPSGVPARTSRSDDSRFAARKGSEASAQFVSGRRSTNRSAPTAQVKPLLRNPPSGGSVPSPSGVPARTSRSDDSRFAARKGSEASAQFVSGRRSTNRSAPTAQVKPLLRNPPSGGSVPSPSGVPARTSRSDDSRFAARKGSEASDDDVIGSDDAFEDDPSSDENDSSVDDVIGNDDAFEDDHPSDDDQIFYGAKVNETSDYFEKDNDSFTDGDSECTFHHSLAEDIFSDDHDSDSEWSNGSTAANFVKDHGTTPILEDDDSNGVEYDCNSTDADEILGVPESMIENQVEELFNNFSPTTESRQVGSQKPQKCMFSIHFDH